MRSVKTVIFLGMILFSFQFAILGTSCSESDMQKSNKRSSVLRFQRVGGWAGFEDDLKVFNDWTYTLMRKTKEVNGTISEEEQQQLLDVLQQCGEIVWERKSPPNIPDGMQESLYLNGHGDETALDNQTIKDILQMIERIMREAEDSTP